MLNSWIIAVCTIVSAFAGKPDKFVGKPVKVAWLGATPDNSYDEANLAGAKAAAKLLHAKVTPFYAQFDPAVQLSQCQNIIKSGKYDAIVVLPASATGIIPCVKKASAAGLKVVATDLPIGPDITTTEPQVPGQTGAVLTPGAEFANSLEGVVAGACAGTVPCRILYLGGVLDFEFEQFSLAALEDIAASNSTVSLVGAYETLYDTEVAYTVVEELLADDVDFDLVIAGGDQMAKGAEWAIADAGIPAGAIGIYGGGASEYGVEAVRDGRWYGTFITLPYDEGALATAMAIFAARCLPIWDDSIDPVVLRGLPPVMTGDNLDEFADFEAQWPG